jgi:hypothetical protein
MTFMLAEGIRSVYDIIYIGTTLVVKVLKD